MCCANKNFVTSLILWLITLFGLSPLAGEWAATFENWTGISLTDSRPVVIAYQQEGEMALYAHVFGPAVWNDVPISQAVVTFHRTESEKELAYVLCRQMADKGYVAITFEVPTLGPDEAASAYPDIADAAMRWMYESRETLGVAPSEIAVWAQVSYDGLAACLAGHAVRASEEDSLETRASSSALIYVCSPILPRWGGVRGSADTDKNMSWLDEVQPNLPSTVLLLSDEAPPALARHAEDLQSRLNALASRCKIVCYSGEQAESTSARALQRETDAIAEVMHEALQSVGFSKLDEE